MIPKRIFYVWGYGEAKSRLAEICLENWHLMLPDYEIIEINEKSKEWFDFDAIYASNLWFKTVYDLKMWAYVSDYMRIKTVYEHSGIYFDTDVTVYKDFTPLLTDSMFVGQSWCNIPDPSIFGAEKHNPILKDMLEFYDEKIWESPLYIITQILKETLMDNYHLSMDKTQIISSPEVTIYPTEYFQPFYYTEEFNRKCITPNTYTAHWQNNSWATKRNLYFLSNKHKIPLKVLLKQLELIDKVDAKANKKLN